MSKIVKDKEEFTKLVLSGYTIPQLMEKYKCSRGAIATAKRDYNLVGKTPNSQKADYVEGTKHCFSCGETKSLNLFYSNGYTPNGTKKYKPTCSTCERSTRDGNFISRLMSLLKTLGMEYKCKDCNLTGEYGLLDFHHRDPSKKLFSIGFVRYGTLSENAFTEKYSDEINKCDILCPTCHRKRHLLRG